MASVSIRNLEESLKSRLRVQAATHGRPIGAFDAGIAAIARSRGATLATQNTADFEGCGVDVIDPSKPKSG